MLNHSSRRVACVACLAAAAVAPFCVAAGLAAQNTTQYTNPVPLGINDSKSNNAYGVLTNNENISYFASDRAGGKGGYDLYQASRSKIAAAFGNVTALAGLNTLADETMPHLSFGELELYFVRRSGCTFADLYLSTRASKTAAWGTPVKLGSPINAKNRFVSYPAISADGLKLYLTMRIG